MNYQNRKKLGQDHLPEVYSHQHKLQCNGAALQKLFHD